MAHRRRIVVDVIRETRGDAHGVVRGQLDWEAEHDAVAREGPHDTCDPYTHILSLYSMLRSLIRLVSKVVRFLRSNSHSSFLQHLQTWKVDVVEHGAVRHLELCCELGVL